MRAVYWLFRDVTLPSLRRHRLRAGLTLSGVVIGVQLLVTVRLIGSATLRSFQHTIETIAGTADLQIANGDVGVPETLVERIATVLLVTHDANAAGYADRVLYMRDGMLDRRAHAPALAF